MSADVTVPAFLTRFKCLGADCEDTCCKTWNMQVDAATHERYRKQAPELLESVVSNKEQAVMRRDPRTDYCVKFEGGICGIHKKYGEEFLGDACHLYPRSPRILGTQAAMSATLSCPEIARLALFEDAMFPVATIHSDRLSQGLEDCLPEDIDPKQAIEAHHTFLHAALDPDTPPERIATRIFVVSESLARITTSAWPDAVPFYLEHADASLPIPRASTTDPVFLLQALCGLVAAAKYVHSTRLMQTIEEMENALHVKIRWDTLAIATLPDSMHAAIALYDRWRRQWRAQFVPLLKRYLAMQLSLAVFPFAGFGNTLPHRAAVIGIRFATIRLGLMSLCAATNGAPEQNDIVRVVQSLSRFLDHLAGAELSEKIYQETGWLKGARLRALLDDGVTS